MALSWSGCAGVFVDAGSGNQIGYVSVAADYSSATPGTPETVKGERQGVEANAHDQLLIPNA
jgi:hypothetical protein